MTEASAYAAPWDQKLLTLTILFSAILLGAAALTAWLGLTRLPASTVRLVVLANACIPVGVLVLSLLLAPRSYAIRGGALRIDRLLAPIEIPLASIEAVEPLPAERVAGASRSLGNGGLFGYYGRFHNAALGSFRMYATRGEGFVLVRGRAPYVLTPESPDRFIEALNRERSLVHGG